MPSSRRPSFSATRRLARVARHDRRLEPVQPQRLERVADEQHDTFGNVFVAAARLVDPVADVAHLERTALHAAEAHLAREAAVGEEQAEAVRGVEVALPFPRRAPRPERLVVECGIRAARPRAPAPSARATGGSAAAPRATPPSRRPASGRSNTRAPMSSVMSRARGDRVERRRIFEAGQVAGRVSGHDRADRAAQHLRAPRLRQRGRESHLARA